MKLFEIRNVPKTAGVAKLDFGKRNTNGRIPPFRAGTVIVLPDNPELELFSLKEGEQFLLRNTVSGSYTKETQFWFGGTDESPFLVRLLEQPFNAFQKEGADSFFKALKPGIVIQLEERFHVSARRQGDIFAVPVPKTWEEIRDASSLCLDIRQDPSNVKLSPVFGTRHKFTGLKAEKVRLFGGEHTLVEGVLEAPDHSPVRLERVHLIVQARNLYEPSEAD